MEKKFISIGNETLAYLDEGVGDVVLMVHGNMSSSVHYEPLITRIKDKYRCVAGEPYRIFNMERFISCDTLRRNKEKLRFGNKCSDELMHASSESFDEAFSIHSETESIYISAMDFFEKERFTAELVKEFETYLESRKND